VVGGVIPKKDIPALKAMGVREVYPIGSTFDEIVQGIRKIVNK
jgi:methylmalonyl-CoA mutase cobalamin-binding domain/chain